MIYSKDGLHLTEQFEGCKLKAYKDSGGVWTIGYGHTHGVYSGMTCTPDQAEQWLQGDIDWAEAFVNKTVTVPLTQHEFDALVDFVFNAGSGNFDHSTVLRLLNAGDYAGAAKHLEDWDKVKGATVAGLLRRRLAEEAEFNAA